MAVGSQERLLLPGGEITIFPKPMSWWQRLGTYAAHEIKVAQLSMSLYPDYHTFGLEKAKDFLARFYQPPIPEALWRRPIRSTTQLQIERQL